MTLATYAAQRRKLEKEIQRLQKQAAALEKKQRAPVINTIVRSMREHDITPEEIANAFSRKSRSASKPANANSGAARAPVPPKFRNPETGATWSGRGKAPRWITEAEEQGKSRDDFLIER